MSHHKHRLSEAIESAVEKTLNSATESTSPHPEEYWYNLKTGEVERGQQSAVTSLWGPSKPTRRRHTPWTAPANATTPGKRTAAGSKARAPLALPNVLSLAQRPQPRSRRTPPNRHTV